MSAGNPMTQAEFRKRLNQLMKEIVTGLLFYAAWTKIRFYDDQRAGWSKEDHRSVVETFGDFLTPVANALVTSALLQFAKIYDKDGRTVSLITLMGTAQRCPSLVPRKTPAELVVMSKRLKGSAKTAEELWKVRNQKLAHADANPTHGDLLRKDFDKLIEDTKAAYDDLHVGSEGSSVAWDFPVEGLARDADELMGALVAAVRSDSP